MKIKKATLKCLCQLKKNWIQSKTVFILSSNFENKLGTWTNKNYMVLFT